jgi:crotonobetainyl-CoA:carnitine CoA-transferase CaiB-like acyl-CoA transferase
MVHLAELEPVLLRAFAQQGKHRWFHAAQEWRLPFGIVQTAEDLARCPQLESRGFWAEIPRAETPALRYPTVPYRSTPPSYTMRRAAPTLGQHNAAVYCGELGYSAGQLARLREAGIV